MKKLFFVFMLLSAFLTGCNQTDDLWDEVNDLKNRVTSLETKIKDLNGNIEALSELCKQGTTITSVDLKDGTYTITLSDGKVLKLVEKNDATALFPLVSVDEEGYWMVSYDNGKTYNRITVNGAPVKATGTDGITPKFRTDADGYWQVDYSDGKGYVYVLDEQGNKVNALGNGSGGSAPSTDKFFEDVQVRDGALYIKLADGTELNVPIVSNFYCRFAEEITGVQKINAGETKSFPVEMKGVDNVMITKPDGWQAVLNKDESKPDDATAYLLQVTAPMAAKASARVSADTNKDIAILATSGSFAAIAKIQVEVMEKINYLSMYNAGKDIVIGGVTVNKATYPNAETITANTDTDIADKFASTDATVLFLEGNGKFMIDATKAVNVTAPIIVIASDPEKMANIEFGEAAYLQLSKGMLLFKNVNIKARSSNYIFNNPASGNPEFTHLVIEDSKVSNIVKGLFYVGTTTVGITNIQFNNSTFAFNLAANAANIMMFNISNTPNPNLFKNLTMQNCILYNALPAKIQLFNWGGSSTTDTGTMTVSLTNNSFINLKGSNIFIKTNQIDLTCEKNIFSIFTESDFTSYLVDVKSESSVLNVTDNILYDTKINWSIAGSSTPASIKPNPNTLPKVDSNPFVGTPDYVNGIFTKASGMEGYGANR